MLGGSGTVKEGARRGLPTEAGVAFAVVASLPDMFSLPRSAVFTPAPEEGLVGRLTSLALGEASAAKREAFMVSKLSPGWVSISADLGPRENLHIPAFSSLGHRPLGCG